MRVAFAPEAIDDLDEIRSFIAQDNPAAALRIAAQLVAACDQLEKPHHKGRPGFVMGTRELTHIRPLYHRLSRHAFRR
jgi:toxin ParE1/3/4